MRIHTLTYGLLATFGCGSWPSGSTRQDSGAPTRSTDDCRGPGAYEAGKEGSYRPCCPGLTEVFHKGAVYADNRVPVCAELPLRIYACVRGECGDGICEVGESRRCGCVLDCPSAVWEQQDAGAPTDGNADL
jgi:hypothetical protein